MQKTPSIKQVEKIKIQYTNDILNNYKKFNINRSYKNNFYFNESKKILEKINIYYYGNNAKYLNIKLKSINSDYLNIEALPNNTILITTAFLDLLNQEFFTENELIGIICHESAHILNADWDNLIREENRKIEYTINGRFATSNEIMSSIVSSAMLKAQNVPDELIVPISNINNQINLSDNNIQPLKFDMPYLLNSQNFSIQTEYNADLLSIKCLKNFNVKNSNKVILNMLKKLNNKSENNELSKRIKKIKGI